MDNKQFVLNSMRDVGVQAVRNLQADAPTLDGTAIIEREDYAPDFDPDKQQFLNWPVGSVVKDNDQVWQLLQPYDSTIYKDHPENLRAQWGLCHTKNPLKAKPFVPSYGTSGLYMKGECCTENEKTYISKANNNNFRPSEDPANWDEYTE